MEPPSLLTPTWVRDIFVLFVGLSLSYYLKRRSHSDSLSSRYPLPPGRKGWPILKNALNVPLKNLGPEYDVWGKELNSKIVSASFMGQVIVVANSISVAIDLLDKRSATYSSRPPLAMTNLIGFDYLFATLPYDARWRERRRTFAEHLRPGDMSFIRPQEEEFVRRLIVELNRTPKDFIDVVKGSIGGFIIALGYGIPVKPRNDKHVVFAEYTLEVILDAGTPGKYFLDVIPALKWVPSWFPGAGFKRKAARLAYVPEQFRSAPFSEALSYLGTDKSRPSLISMGLEAIDSSKPDAGHKEQLLKDAAAMLYAAGTETVVATILNWTWLMMKYPVVQARVHCEIDTVLGGRMPDLDDQESLPYLMATFMEATRVKPATPMGVPHCSTADDVYNGYFIPKDSIVLGNIYAMLRDEEHYDDPKVFNPERFLKAGRINTQRSPNPFDFAFGFGRRACPGAHIGLSMSWLAVASLAAVYRWSEHAEVDGGCDADAFTTGFICQPISFKCDFVIRSPEAQAYLTSLQHLGG